MTQLKITAGPFTFDARLEEAAAPKTCASFLKRLPFESQVVHVRWSGEGVWIPLGDLDFAVGYENHTSYPAPGQILLYPGGISETEILLSYGGVHFACKMANSRQPFHHRHVGPGEPRGARQDDALAGCTEDRLRKGVTGSSRRTDERDFPSGARPPPQASD